MTKLDIQPLKILFVKIPMLYKIFVPIALLILVMLIVVSSNMNDGLDKIEKKIDVQAERIDRIEETLQKHEHELPPLPESPEEPKKEIEDAKKRTSKYPSAVRPYNEEEIKCLALNIYHEARNEPMPGRAAVGIVTMNRMFSEHYPGTVCEVVWQRKYKRFKTREGGKWVAQFSWTLDGKSDKAYNKKAYIQSLELAQVIYLNYQNNDQIWLVDFELDPEFTSALYYHADYVNPYWGRVKKANGKYIVTIGRHLFYS